jgi:AraC-like DNA-binding protein
MPGHFLPIPAGPVVYREESLPRHWHADAHAILVLSGSFEQIGYAGRFQVCPGDLLVTPTLDCHLNRGMSRSVELIRFPWSWTGGFGGVYRGDFDPEAVRRVADHDLCEARALVEAKMQQSRPVTFAEDWEDILARRLRSGASRIGSIAGELGMSREAVSRGFSRLYGVSPVTFRSEIRLRKAWLAIQTTGDRLCSIALDAGFADQPHMTRAMRQTFGFTPSHLRRARQPTHASPI